MKIFEIKNRGDHRGDSFELPQECYHFIGQIADLHFATFFPGALRGNHYHLKKREILIFQVADLIEIFWRAPGSEHTQSKNFVGPMMLACLVEPGWGHAVKNPGKLPIGQTALCSRPYDSKDPDSFAWQIT
ncbi:MAG: hypothetical protein A2508_09975 [Candidatus Lambdaproteobacteria bacterium RIFOXYD12_FULL_49_8]|uniref:Capsular polysaccharide assembling protein CapF C-terminal domain-containing protein n=1 Tax=Candidatus Lambdaproteobacteria bacterium RIFOXYD2_FULL_50_16 TaxID=1817772 RepID=A0A1F6GFF8_9PROT|nr:MAG: hypothetical protein A2527_00235 [Candidatus Lambdaproteobacteria bacterium RIFOXYD2_FULL_50_16]OGG97951.1 MAG: hypothetical protein A2508_09975 [Candidatus Lambdaproteobacteria bacterium RIFOXYD12_FULL_49_8]